MYLTYTLYETYKYLYHYILTLTLFVDGRKKSRLQRSAKHVGHCNHHVIELCPLPQWCNSFCPAFRNQYTGEAIDFFKLFADSDIDRSSIAEILGKNFSAEDNLKPEEISKLLEKKFRKKSSLT